MRKAKKKTNKTLLIVILIFIILLLILFGFCRSFSTRCLESSTLPERVFINGTDCSGMDKKDARYKLVREWNTSDFEIRSDDKVIAEISMHGMKYRIKDKINSCISDAGFFAYIRYILGKPYNIEIPMTVRRSSPSFNSDFKDFCNEQDKGTTKTKNAYMDLDTTDFEVVPEVYGDNVDRKLLRSTIYEAIENGTMYAEYSKDDFIDVPEITADSKEIKDMLDYCHTYLSEKITYDFGKEKYTLTPKQLNKLIYLDQDDDTVKTHDDAIKEFVDDLAYHTDTYGLNRKFKSTLQGEVTLYGGAYGYVIDRGKEAEQLKKDVTGGKDVEREPIYSYKGNGRNGNDDIGSTYLEVDLSHQKLWYYKNGKSIFTSPFVSGNLKDNTGTIVGTYSLAYKELDATLKGANVDGSDYESEVKYWMPFCNGYGLHDAPWRDSFGGDIYKTNGSHGCINLPPSKAKELFSIIRTHDIIVIFY